MSWLQPFYDLASGIKRKLGLQSTIKRENGINPDLNHENAVSKKALDLAYEDIALSRGFRGKTHDPKELAKLQKFTSDAQLEEYAIKNNLFVIAERILQEEQDQSDDDQEGYGALVGLTEGERQLLQPN